jgi:hypothetical protein
MACDDYSFVRRAYWVLLGREPDPGGLTNYLDRLRSGTPKLQVLSELAQSPEGKAKGAVKSDDAITAASTAVILSNTAGVAATWDQLLGHHGRAFITCAYQTLLGRNPDPEGLQLYLAQLCSGVAKIQILGQLRHSAEYKTRTRGQKKQPLVRHLDREAMKLRLASLPLFGWILKAALGVDGNSPMEIRLRRIEYQLLSASRENDISPQLQEANSSPIPPDRERKIEQPKSVMHPIPRDIADAPSLATTPVVATLRSLPMPTNWKKETEHG